MWTDRLIAIICLAGFISFLLVSAVYVQEFDLIIVFGVTIAMVTYDFWISLFRSDAGKNGNNGNAA